MLDGRSRTGIQLVIPRHDENENFTCENEKEQYSCPSRYYTSKDKYASTKNVPINNLS